MTILDDLGIESIINGAGYATRLGGALMSEPVIAAMVSVASVSVDMAALQAAASKQISRYTGADAGLVTPGASAALQLSAAACLARLDVDVMDRLPDTRGIPNEIVMMRTHRTGYDHALRSSGAIIRDVGYNTRGMGAGGRGVERWEVEGALGDMTVALAGTATADNFAEIEMLAEVAGKAALPLIVDAAAQIPPLDNLRRFIDMGASLVAFSGGKAIRGPQNTGILAGQHDLIMSAALQTLDMDEVFETWNPPASLIDVSKIAGLPHHGLGRSLKVSKEAVAGLLAALHLFASSDQEALGQLKTAVLDQIELGLKDVNGLELRRVENTRWGWPRLELRIKPGIAFVSCEELSIALKRSSPSVYLNEQYLAEEFLVLDPANLDHAQVEVLVAAIGSICRIPEESSAFATRGEHMSHQSYDDGPLK